MDRISGLSDELLVKILSFAPTKVVVSTSVLSKRWESLWLCVPKLHFFIDNKSVLPIRDFINKNLPLLKPPVIESFRIRFCYAKIYPEEIEHWIGITVSRCVRELDLDYLSCRDKPILLLPNSLYTSKSLVSLKLNGNNILVDVPRTVDLPCLKTLELRRVTFSNKDSLQLLLSYCPVLEELTFKRYGIYDDNVKTIVVIIVPSLLRLTLAIESGCNTDGYVIVTPSLKYFEVEEYYRDNFSYMITHMPKVEEADLIIQEGFEKLFESITSVKRLSLFVEVNLVDESMYHYGLVFNHLEHIKLCINCDYWSKLLVRLLEDSPKLRVLKILVDSDAEFEEYEPLSWYNDESSVPKCLLETLETFEFEGYTGRQEERDIVSYILKNAPHLKSSSIKQ